MESLLDPPKTFNQHTLLAAIDRRPPPPHQKKYTVYGYQPLGKNRRRRKLIRKHNKNELHWCEHSERGRNNEPEEIRTVADKKESYATRHR
ncbi:hypothetical protein GEV33_012046 [Tenebrio molitor]|uniref:Uncharacterized protein n=1 Tax=Tenebrio molitor TaxID=7067 RepID=A0A8J6L411_TENMO|nr:hypothetical protein GEV33_012046 [Tenebrio molitor]